MFFLRLHYHQFQESVKKLCHEHEYMMWTADMVYRFMYYVEKILKTKLESDVFMKYSIVLRDAFLEFADS